MTRVYFLQITGGTIGDYVFQNILRLVETSDPDQIVGNIRARFRRDLAKGVVDGRYPAELVNAMSQSLRVKMLDTGLTEYPDTSEEEVELFNKLQEAINERKEALVLV
jgi:hypothetical protein